MLSTRTFVTYFKTLMAKFALLATFIITALTACSSNSPLPMSAENLTEVKAGGFDHVLMPNGEALKPFSKVYIEDPSVSFNKHWLRDLRGDYTDGDLERITSSYGEQLKKSLTKELTDSSQASVVDSAAEADIIFRPLLRDLHIYGPDLTQSGRTEKFVNEIGNGTFDLTLLQASDKTVIAQFIDTRETSASASGRLERTDRVTNFRYFRMLMDRWSHNLTEYLVDANAVSAK